MARLVQSACASTEGIRDGGSIPGWGRCPWKGHGSPCQCSCLESPMGRGAWWATVHGVVKSRARLKYLSTHIQVKRYSACLCLTFSSKHDILWVRPCCCKWQTLFCVVAEQRSRVCECVCLCVYLHTHTPRICISVLLLMDTWTVSVSWLL